MGRKLRRVPLDFNWPIDEIWEGYINPHWQHRRECEMCQGSGYGPETKILSDQWYGYTEFKPAMTGNQLLTVDTPEVLNFAKRNVERSQGFYAANRMATVAEAKRLSDYWNSQWCHHLDQDDVQALVDGGRLMDFTHTWTKGEGWKRREDSYVPTAKEVNLWSLGGLGHDSLNHWICVRAKAKRLGYVVECPYCGGSGDQWRTEEDKATYENWEESDPPTGDGFQLWTTTNEGAPISPVFSTLEALCEWTADNATTFGSEKATKEEWLKMLDEGFVYHQEGNFVFM